MTYTSAQIASIVALMGSGWDTARVTAALSASTAQQIADLKLLCAALFTGWAECIIASAANNPDGNP